MQHWKYTERAYEENTLNWCNIANIQRELMKRTHLTLKVLHFWKLTYKWSGWISDSYCSLKPLCSGMGEVVPARTSPTLPPHPLALCCNYPVSKCPSASIVATSTLRVNWCNIANTADDNCHDSTTGIWSSITSYIRGLRIEPILAKSFEIIWYTINWLKLHITNKDLAHSPFIHSYPSVSCSQVITSHQ